MRRRIREEGIIELRMYGAAQRGAFGVAGVTRKTRMRREVEWGSDESVRHLGPLFLTVDLGSFAQYTMGSKGVE